MKNEFVFFKNGNNSVLYHIPSAEFYRVYDNEYILSLDNYINNDIPSEHAEKILANVSESKIALNTVVKSNLNVEIDSKNFIINKLVFVLTTNCNLRCKYCYANHGTYCYGEAKTMSNEDLLNAIDYFVNNFKGINTIQFFGGEPTLCDDKIELAVNRINALYEEGKLEKKPTYGLVSNGMYLSDNLLKIYKENNFGITLSIDGKEYIQNLLRPDCYGKDSYNKVYSTYTKMKEYGIKNINIETTYTNAHIENDISLKELVEFFSTELSVKVPHIVPVSIDDSNELSVKNNLDKFKLYLKEMIKDTLDRYLMNKPIQSMSLVMGNLYHLIAKEFKENICPAGMRTISISPDGSITPCFMYTSDDEVAYGKIGDNATDILKQAMTFNEKINAKERCEVCKNCFAKSICSSCLGYFKKHKDKGVQPTSDIYCDISRYIFREILLQLSVIRGNEEAWNHLKERIAHPLPEEEVSII